MARFYLCIWILCGDVAAASHSIFPSPAHDAVVVVSGKKQDVRKATKLGRRTTYQGNSLAGNDLKAIIAEEVSLFIPETGTANPGGFQLPRFRGQDIKGTEVWIDNTNLLDPWTGLATIEDIDLGAYDAVHISLGNSTYRIPTTNPVGLLQVRRVSP